MTRFYNRHPWNLVVGLLLVVAILNGVAMITAPWVAAVPLVLVALYYVKLWSNRAIQLRSKGYFSGRRVGKKWIYEERCDGSHYSLALDLENTEPGRYEIFIPTDQQWRVEVPAWARDRRAEIAGRIADVWKAEDFHFENDAANV